MLENILDGLDANKLTESANDHDDDDLDSSEHYKVYKKNKVSTDYTVILSEEITSSVEYYDLYNLFYSASPLDTVTVYLNNFGGKVHTGVHLVNAIASSRAKVTMVVTAPVYSMGAILAVAGDEMILHPHTFLMFHDYSGGEFGKGNEIHLSVTNYRRYFRELLNDVCGWFLTKEEVKSILTGQDLYVSYDDARRRMKVHADKAKKIEAPKKAKKPVKKKKTKAKAKRKKK